ncbi:MAG: synthase subunit b 2 [Pseudomonadota bacterium]
MSMFVTEAFAQSSTTGDAQMGAAPEAEVHTETGVPHEAAHEGGFPPFDPTYFGSQLLWLAVAFGLFYVFMSRTITPRIASIVEGRQARISGDIAEANAAKASADEAVKAYESELASAKSKAGAIAATARDAAKAKADAERHASEAALQEKIAAAEKRIAEIKTAALGEVGGIAEETASAIVEQLVGSGISKSDIASAVKSVSGK